MTEGEAGIPPGDEGCSVRRGERQLDRQATANRRATRVVVGVLLAGVLAGGCGGGKHGGDASADPTVRRAQAVVDAPPPPLSAYRGPARGPPAAQPPLPVVFVAADLSDGGIAAEARAVQEAARTIGWPLKILDGGANVQGERQALLAALRLRPGGIILGGINAIDQRATLRAARERGVPVVGWHSEVRPGPDRKLGLFTNVTSDPTTVARLAADYAIADSGGTAGVVIFTDRGYAIDTYTANVMGSEIRKCRRCSVLQAFDIPIANAPVGLSGVVAALLQRYGKRLGYLLAVSGAYIDGARAALIGAGRQGDQPPLSITAGYGDESEFARIRGDDYQTATVAEPLDLQGWQLIDELNRARAHQPPSGYVAPPRLITKSDVPNGPVFDPPSGYRKNYLQIWHPRGH